jgi:drug/metabolite transporter (DMT)-like permease
MGESLCLIFAAIDRFRDPKKYLLKEDFAKFSGKYRPKVSVYIIPALLDFLSSICMFAAIGMISGSTYQFMRSGSLITTALFSRYFAKLKFKKHQKWACVIAFGSLLLIALS